MLVSQTYKIQQLTLEKWRDFTLKEIQLALRDWCFWKRFWLMLLIRLIGKSFLKKKCFKLQAWSSKKSLIRRHQTRHGNPSQRPAPHESFYKRRVALRNDTSRWISYKTACDDLFCASHFTLTAELQHKLQARRFLTVQIKYVNKIGVIFWRIVTQRNDTHGKPTRVGNVKYWSISLFCGERDLLAICRIFWRCGWNALRY